MGNSQKTLKRILFTIGNLSGGGAERVVSILANAFSERGIQVCVCCIGRTQLPQVYILNDSVEIVHIHAGKGKGIWGKFNQLLHIRRFVKVYHANVVVAFMSYIAIQTRIACFFTKNHVVFSTRNQIASELNSKLMKFLGRILLDTARGAVFQNEAQKAFFKSYKKRKDIIIHNPVQDIDAREWGDRGIKKTIVAVGRLVPAKNYLLLLRAFQRVHACYPEYILQIFGEGDLREELERICVEKGIKEAVQFRGFQKNIIQYLACASMYVMSSNYEGIPNALLEALCLGVPCVSTDFGGGSAGNLIKSGINGILVPLGDAEAMAESICRLIENPEEARRMGCEAKKMRDEYCIDNIAKIWIHFLEKI